MSSVKTEVAELCSQKSPSLLRKNDIDSLQSLTHKDIWHEWSSRAPTFCKVLTACASNPSQLQNKRKTEDSKLPAIVSAGATLLKESNQKMSALHYINGLALKKGGTKTSAFDFMNKTGVSVVYDQILGLQDKIAEKELTRFKELKRPIIVGDNVDMRTHVRHMTSSK